MKVLRTLFKAVLFAGLVTLPACNKATDTVHVYDMVELSFIADLSYENPYMEVDLWVDLKGPGKLEYRIPAFWDSEQTWRVRLAATAPGKWRWSTGRETGDPGQKLKRKKT